MSCSCPCGSERRQGLGTARRNKVSMNFGAFLHAICIHMYIYIYTYLITYCILCIAYYLNNIREYAQDLKPSKAWSLVPGSATTPS